MMMMMMAPRSSVCATRWCKLSHFGANKSQIKSVLLVSSRSRSRSRNRKPQLKPQLQPQPQLRPQLRSRSQHRSSQSSAERSSVCPMGTPVSSERASSRWLAAWPFSWRNWQARFGKLNALCSTLCAVCSMLKCSNARMLNAGCGCD